MLWLWWSESEDLLSIQGQKVSGFEKLAIDTHCKTKKENLQKPAKVILIKKKIIEMKH